MLRFTARINKHFEVHRVENYKNINNINNILKDFYREIDWFLKDPRR